MNYYYERGIPALGGGGGTGDLSRSTTTRPRRCPDSWTSAAPACGSSAPLALGGEVDLCTTLYISF